MIELINEQDLINFRTLLDIVPNNIFNNANMRFNSDTNKLEIYDIDLNDSFIVSANFDILSDKLAETMMCSLPLNSKGIKHIYNNMYNKFIISDEGINLESENVNLFLVFFKNATEDYFDNLPVTSIEMMETINSGNNIDASENIEIKIKQSDIKNLRDCISSLNSKSMDDEYKLKNGKNGLTIKATDYAGNKFEITFPSNKTIKKIIKFDTYFNIFFSKLSEFKEIEEFVLYINDGCVTTSFVINGVNVCYAITSLKD